MNSQLYDRFGAQWVDTYRCTKNNHISEAEAEAARERIDKNLQRYDFDQATLQKSVDREERTPQPSYERCFSLLTAEHQHMRNMLNAQRAANSIASQQQFQQQFNQNATKTTWCNRFGQQVMCTTY
ncbi:hypothetical protein [Xenophilus sp. Marseille-Q4582]|uniref:hypothetical protein n=1 Tax=Xenophilus sp. Marseille-Q4582 TaxID=2866600 RepID=UPI001CE4490A|nr:hypothetical protein [Xenophilus sp. Marseille-Q4582]